MKLLQCLKASSANQDTYSCFYNITLIGISLDGLRRYERVRESFSTKKRMSIALITAVPTTFAISLSLIAFLLASKTPLANDRHLLFFLLGLVLALVIVAPQLRRGLARDFSLLAKVDTLIHELKHAAVAVLLGGRLTDVCIYAEKRDGKVGHMLYKCTKKRRHIRVFVTLAPYYFPLFSLPTFCAIKL